MCPVSSVSGNFRSGETEREREGESLKDEKAAERGRGEVEAA